jgi:hypothetical protein
MLLPRPRPRSLLLILPRRPALLLAPEYIQRRHGKNPSITGAREARNN